MTNSRWTLRVAAALTALVVGGARLSAQVTTGTITGTVTNEQGQPIEAAQIRVQNRSTGFSVGVQTHANGRYTVPGLQVGSNYSVTVRRIGYQPHTVEPVNVGLGQVTPVDFRLAVQAAQLTGVVVTAETQDQTISPSHTGTVTAITDSALRRLPTLNRNFTDFVALTPQVSTTSISGGLSGGGTNNRFNNITIDGISETDMFGLGSTGQPGGQANGKSIGLEAVKEYQVLLAPYDVREGNFAGLAINAVTKSGTNEFHGSAIGVTRNQSYTRSQPYIAKFNQSQYAFSVGGPIVKDKAFFFISPEFQSRTTPASGPYLGQPGVNLSAARVDSISTALKAYGYTDKDIGNGGLVTNENPLRNVFARLDFTLPFNSQLVIRDNYGYAQNDVFSRSNSGFSLSQNGYKFKSTKNAPAGELRTLFTNGGFNELRVGLTSIRDRRAPNSLAPQVTVNGAGFGVVAGAERSSQGNELDQDIFEVTDNYTLPIGAHRVTIGTQNQFMKFRNLFAQNSYGAWTFGSLDSLVAGNANNLLLGVPNCPASNPGCDGAVRFKSNIYSGYIEDEWSVTPKFNLQYGVRADIPVFPTLPPSNPSILTNYGRDTHDFPSGNVEWSPRAGFNYDVTGDQKNQVRGGLGLFTGHPAYVWLSNGFQNSGYSGFAQLTCTRPRTGTNNVPAFTGTASRPTTCADNKPASAGSEIDLVSPNFKFPQNLRGNLAYDHRLGNSNWIATFEGIYTKGVNGVFYRNVALAGVRDINALRGKSAAEAGRYIYGTGAAGSGSGTPDTVTGGRTKIFEATNQNRDYAYNLTAGLQRRYSNNFEGAAYYTYSRSFDVMSFTSSTAESQYRFGRAWGYDQNSTDLGRSIFEERHRIVAYGTYTFAATHTDLSVQYFGESGTPYGYVVNGDPNADGETQNDPIYVPKNATDPTEMAWAASRTYNNVTYTGPQMAQAFENFINNTKCLRDNRGKLLPRNICDNPFTNTVNVLLRQSFKTIGYQNVTLEFGVFNFLNLVNRNWGAQPSAGFGSQTLLDQTGISGANLVTGKPIYAFNPGYKQFLANNIASNYQMQLSLRYSF